MGSGRAIHGNLVNSIAPEPLNGLEPKLTKILAILGRRTDYVFKVMRLKVKVTVTFASGSIQIDGSPCTVMLMCANRVRYLFRVNIVLDSKKIAAC